MKLCTERRCPRVSLFMPCVLLLIFYSFSSGQKIQAVNQAGWENLHFVLDKIKAPQFPEKDFSIIENGAIPDGSQDSRPSIEKTILLCSQSGGGRVVIPKGRYFVKGPIYLKSNVNLHLNDGAVLNFSTDAEDYLPAVFTRWEGMECYNYSALIYAFGEENIALSGKGTFDGEASNANWWKWSGKKEFGWEKGIPSQKDSLSRPLLVKMNKVQTDVEKRVFGKGHNLRPNFVQFYKCKNILIEDATFLNSPMWVINPVLSQNITVRNISTIGEGPNTDGCDPESCSDMLITNSFFKNGDDCIAIKSGRNNDGRRVNVPSENIVIQKCKMNDGHGGITIGSEVSGGCRNIYAEDCELNSPNLDKAVRIKANSYRGGVIENIFVRNLKIGEVKEAVVHFDMNYEPAEGNSGNFPPLWRNIQITHVTSKKSNQAFYLSGLAKSKIQNVVISNCDFEGVLKKPTIKNVSGLEIKNSKINGHLYEF